MKSSKSSISCFGTLVLGIFLILSIHYFLPGFWTPLITVGKGIFFFGFAVFLLVIAVVAFFTIKNLRSNKKRDEESKYTSVLRTENLYRSIVDRLQKDVVLNEVSPEELLQAEVLMSDKLKEIKTDLIRLHEFTSSSNRKMLDLQAREYQQKLRNANDETMKQVVQENLQMVQEKQKRVASAAQEISDKEALVDLAFHSLTKVDEDLRFKRPVTQLFSSEVYRRFGLTAPQDQDRLPPFVEKSSE
jgi:predicted negative regulator of RcsB-dependent stress response